ncbi:hypothetical protein NDU88_000600 [Pleurodeles waltl]|uniref:Uncharacterized protein n=1 Tax=Pleurodeles waltl TaxID=8319 RepID=A0AAV7V6N6_PLEWA|nr:hypothetical protein NDU88_000600 [Pleurodeles waltl]
MQCISGFPFNRRPKGCRAEPHRSLPVPSQWEQMTGLSRCQQPQNLGSEKVVPPHEAVLNNLAARNTSHISGQLLHDASHQPSKVERGCGPRDVGTTMELTTQRQHKGAGVAFTSTDAPGTPGYAGLAWEPKAALALVSDQPPGREGESKLAPLQNWPVSKPPPAIATPSPHLSSLPGKCYVQPGPGLMGDCAGQDVVQGPSIAHEPVQMFGNWDNGGKEPNLEMKQFWEASGSYRNFPLTVKGRASIFTMITPPKALHILQNTPFPIPGTYLDKTGTILCALLWRWGHPESGTALSTLADMRA